jgi:hypothetical protein
MNENLPDLCIPSLLEETATDAGLCKAVAAKSILQSGASLYRKT